MRRVLLVVLLVLPLIGLLGLARTWARTGEAGAEAARQFEPRYADGRLLRPEGYEKWVFVGASLGLSYSENALRSGSETFHHVYLEPGAYDHFARTGTFPEQTMLVLELHQRAEHATPRRQGSFEGERLAVEVALKDSARFEAGWAYFDFSDGLEAANPFPAKDCANCHAEHADDDNVFTQFYPVLRRLKSAG